MQTKPVQNSTVAIERPAAPDNAGSAAGIAVPVGIGVAEAAVIVALFNAGAGNALVCLAVHLAVVALLLAWLARRSGPGRDMSVPTLLVVTLAAVGPLGIPLALVFAPFVRADGEQSRLLESWYARLAHSTAIDSSVQLAERVSAGRTLDLSRPASGSFTAVIGHGTVLEQQAALGRIVRNFTPAYLPVLKLALKSPEPVIRVQAAAVATRVRPTIQTIIDQASVIADNGAATAERILMSAHDIDLILGSGLLDVADRDIALGIKTRLAARRTLGADRSALDSTLATLALSPFARLQAETRLIETGEFRALRRLRRVGRIMLGQAYRLRPLPRPAARTARGTA